MLVVRFRERLNRQIYSLFLSRDNPLRAVPTLFIVLKNPQKYDCYSKDVTEPLGVSPCKF